MVKKSGSKSRRSSLKKEITLPIISVLLASILVIIFVNIQSTTSSSERSELIKAAVNTSTLLIPDTSFTVTLRDGKADFSDEITQGSVQLSEPYVSVQTSEGIDTFSTMQYSTGGSGEFVAIALFHTIDGTTTFANAYVIGDRVTVQNIKKIAGDKNVYTMQVEYLDRDENAPMSAEPTIKKSLTIQVDKHKIVSTPQE